MGLGFDVKEDPSCLFSLFLYSVLFLGGDNYLTLSVFLY